MQWHAAAIYLVTYVGDVVENVLVFNVGSALQCGGECWYSQSGLSGQQKNPSKDHMSHWGMRLLKKSIPGRDATCYELQHATQLSGPPVVFGAVLTLQDDNNGTGNDNGIERNRYHGKELVV